jgi:putative acetyltransferase
LIRPAGASDNAEIGKLLRAVFETPVEADLVVALHAAGAMLCELVDVGSGDVNGYVAASAMRAPRGCAGLGPLAVAAAARGHGLGGALVNAAIENLREAGIAGVFVLGEPEFYARFGFSLDAARPFETTYPREFMMAMELRPGGLTGQSGTLKYAAPFEALG